MNIKDIIAKKMEKQILTKYEIRFFINGYNTGDITDYEAAGLIMAMCINGITDEEMVDLAVAIAYSGETVDLSEIDSDMVNIFTSNGIGDKITLILIPVLATLDIPVAKIIENSNILTENINNKLKCIPKLNIKIEKQEFIENIQDIYACITNSIENIAPANSKISILKNSISCSGNLQLMAASIISSEIAKGANKIVIHIPVGNTSFIKKEVEARKLAEKIIKIGKLINKQVICVITDMTQPIGYSFGNTLEIIEVIEALKGKIQEDVKQIVLELGAQVIKLYQKGDDINENKSKVMKILNNNKAFDKFVELVENQNGDITYIKNIEKFEIAEYIIPVIVNKRGFVKKIDTCKLQKIYDELGINNIKENIKTDDKVGLIIMKKIGDRIEEGDILGFIHTNNIENESELIENFINCYEISDRYFVEPKTIIEVME